MLFIIPFEILLQKIFLREKLCLLSLILYKKKFHHAIKKKKKKILDPSLFLEKKMENNVSIRFEINDVALAFKYTDNRYVKNVFPRRTR